MKSILEIEVTCFPNYRDTTPMGRIKLLTWLTSDKLAYKIDRLRSIKDKTKRDRIKASLPAITPSGIFSKRKNANLLKHSGLMQFDIDEKDHMHVSNFDELKDEISNLQNVAYIGLSASGAGYWGLIPIQYPEHHREHFQALSKSFKKYGIHIDPAPQNVASLRGYSYDPDGYFNHQAVPFPHLDEPARELATRVLFDNKYQVESCIRQITITEANIAPDYETYLKIAFAFANEFGEAGREFFHRAVSHSPKYTAMEADKQYTSCLDSNGQGITMATFFHICKEHSIIYKPIIPQKP